MNKFILPIDNIIDILNCSKIIKDETKIKFFYTYLPQYKAKCKLYEKYNFMIYPNNDDDEFEGYYDFSNETENEIKTEFEYDDNEKIQEILEYKNIFLYSNNGEGYCITTIERLIKNSFKPNNINIESGEDFYKLIHNYNLLTNISNLNIFFDLFSIYNIERYSDFINELLQKNNICEIEFLKHCNLDLSNNPNNIKIINPEPINSQNNGYVQVNALNYNFLRIMSGMGGLAYSS